MNDSGQTLPFWYSAPTGHKWTQVAMQAAARVSTSDATRLMAFLFDHFHKSYENFFDSTPSGTVSLCTCPGRVTAAFGLPSNISHLPPLPPPSNCHHGTIALIAPVCHHIPSTTIEISTGRAISLAPSPCHPKISMHLSPPHLTSHSRRLRMASLLLAPSRLDVGSDLDAVERRRGPRCNLDTGWHPTRLRLQRQGRDREPVVSEQWQSYTVSNGEVGRSLAMWLGQTSTVMTACAFLWGEADRACPFGRRKKGIVFMHAHNEPCPHLPGQPSRSFARCPNKAPKYDLASRLAVV